MLSDYYLAIIEESLTGPCSTELTVALDAEPPGVEDQSKHYETGSARSLYIVGRGGS